MQAQAVNIDLTGLRDAIGDDAAIAQELFMLFYVTVDRCIEAAAHLIQVDPENSWNDVLHELKGAAMNVGAAGLVGVIASAENIPPGDAVQRTKAIMVLREEATRVTDYLKTIEHGQW